MPIPLVAGEQLLHESIANMIRGIESVGGNLRVTNQRVLFDAHVFNVQYEAIEIPLREIAEVRPRNTLFLVPNGILIRTNEPRDYKFVVWGRGKLIELIGNLAMQARAANIR